MRQFQASLIVIKLQWFFWYITKAKNHWHKRKTWNRNERYWVLTLNVLLLSIEHEIVGHKYCAKIIITFSPYVSLKIWDVDIRILISHDIYLITLYTCLFLSFYYSVTSSTCHLKFQRHGHKKKINNYEKAYPFVRVFWQSNTRTHLTLCYWENCSSVCMLGCWLFPRHI